LSTAVIRFETKGVAMTASVRSLGLVLALILPLPAARADIVHYSFSGSDTLTGSPVSGSFSYQTSTPGHDSSPDRTFFVDVGGQLVINALGRTYASDSVTGILSPQSLTLVSLSGQGGGFGVILKSVSPGVALFSNLTFLPPKLDPAAISGSKFSITDSRGQPVLARGAIRLDGPVIEASQAPEPRGRTLAGLGFALVLLLRRRR
jgi:hypothetical protein